MIARKSDDRNEFHWKAHKPKANKTKQKAFLKRNLFPGKAYGTRQTISAIRLIFIGNGNGNDVWWIAFGAVFLIHESTRTTLLTFSLHSCGKFGNFSANIKLFRMELIWKEILEEFHLWKKKGRFISQKVKLSCWNIDAVKSVQSNEWISQRTIPHLCWIVCVDCAKLFNSKQPSEIKSTFYLLHGRFQCVHERPLWVLGQRLFNLKLKMIFPCYNSV